MALIKTLVLIVNCAFIGSIWSILLILETKAVSLLKRNKARENTVGLKDALGSATLKLLARKLADKETRHRSGANRIGVSCGPFGQLVWAMRCWERISSSQQTWPGLLIRGREMEIGSSWPVNQGSGTGNKCSVAIHWSCSEIGDGNSSQKLVWADLVTRAHKQEVSTSWPWNQDLLLGFKFKCRMVIIWACV